MKEIFIGWITFQLIVIGMSGVWHYNKLVDGTYDCNSPEEKMSQVWGAIFPLAFFAVEDKETEEYCKLQANK